MSLAASTFAAVDLGATSGRVMLARIGPDTLTLSEVRRFPNRPVRAAGRLYWDILGLYGEVLDGLRAAGPGLESIGIDSWAVDYGLIDASGALLSNPVHYRDARTQGVRDHVRGLVSDADLYQTNGLQFLPFNTVYQLAVEERLHIAETLLLIPDLLAYWLTGRVGAEITNASTTGLIDVRSRTWSCDLLERLSIPAGLLPEVRLPGDMIGPVLPETGLPDGLSVVAVASHDTASAVAAVPAAHESFAYISCGTWSLVGVELDGPILAAASRKANFTNEAGIDGTIRYLRNVMGLWLLSESLRHWGAPDLGPLLAAAASVPPLRSVIDPDDARFLTPGDIPARITAFCAETGQPVPPDRPALVRCIMDSLALAHRDAIHQAAELSGKSVDVVHLVGGGARNALLCQLTADACGLPVIAGPVEATAIGNALVQARAAGILGDLPTARALIARTQHPVRYEPRPDRAWTNARIPAGG